MRLLVVFAASLLGLALAACDTTVTKEETAGLDYGPRPERWQEEIRSYLRIRLTDPQSAIVEFRAGPTQMYQRETAVRKQQYGWAFCVWINDKNRSGAYDGYFPMSVFIRDEKIVAVNNGPDDYGVIGARYAREHCEKLGTPFKQ